MNPPKHYNCKNELVYRDQPQPEKNALIMSYEEYILLLKNWLREWPEFKRRPDIPRVRGQYILIGDSAYSIELEE